MNNEDYICPQYGKDENGAEIHALTHHHFPPYTTEGAKDIIDSGIPEEKMVIYMDLPKKELALMLTKFANHLEMTDHILEYYESVIESRKGKEFINVVFVICIHCGKDDDIGSMNYTPEGMVCQVCKNSNT